ncbi:hypothetical protein LMTR3_27895 [Bradyrhizobium sp. LMTR 3]|nr:hypothetical protein LMTR3_27895 [Bradyrhizobium sp. LMTR 3]
MLDLQIVILVLAIHVIARIDGAHGEIGRAAEQPARHGIVILVVGAAEGDRGAIGRRIEKRAAECADAEQTAAVSVDVAEKTMEEAYRTRLY